VQSSTLREWDAAIDRAMTELARDGRIGEAGTIAGNLSNERRLQLIGNERTTVEGARRYNALREDGQ